MGPGIILALLVHGSFATKEAVSGNMVWEETAQKQLGAGFHPVLRFGSWDITRFNRSTTYMFTTPDLVQQGQFQLGDGHYSFRAVMANDLENSDISKLAADMGSGQAEKFKTIYASSLQNFGGDYNPTTRALYVTYPVKGKLTSFELHALIEGDEELSPLNPEADLAAVGIWHAPEPFPSRLDARVRDKIGGMEGLQQFVQEAGASEGAQFKVMDMRVNGTFRLHDIVGKWEKHGSTVTLLAAGGKTIFTLSADGTKLLKGGRPAFERN